MAEFNLDRGEWRQRHNPPEWARVLVDAMVEMWLEVSQDVTNNTQRFGEFMASIEDVQAKLNALGGDVDQVKSDVSTKADEIKNDLAGLKQQITDLTNAAASGAVNQTALDALGTAADSLIKKVTDLDTGVQAIGQDASTPAAPVPTDSGTPSDPGTSASPASGDGSTPVATTTTDTATPDAGAPDPGTVTPGLPDGTVPASQPVNDGSNTATTVPDANGDVASPPQ